MANTQRNCDAVQLTSDELQENLLAVKAALRDIEAGERGRPFEEFAEEFRERNSITKDE